MSEYTPITGELRAAMRQWGWFESDGSITFVSSPMPPSIDAEKALAISGSDFDRYCDAIDSIHAHLERENKDLRVEFVSANRHALHFKRENESLKAELDRVLGEDEGATIPLPLDMDGKPIHFGDVMVMDGDSELCDVVGFYDLGFLAWRNGRFVPCAASLYRHATPDTWERIIEDAIDSVDGGQTIAQLVARCKALCERTKEDA